MSDFDHHHTNCNDDLFVNRNDGPYGGLSISEVLQKPYLAEQYGHYPVQHDKVESIAKANVTNEFNLKALWYVVLAEAVVVGLILFFKLIF